MHSSKERNAAKTVSTSTLRPSINWKWSTYGSMVYTGIVLSIVTVHPSMSSRVNAIQIWASTSPTIEQTVNAMSICMYLIELNLMNCQSWLWVGNLLMECMLMMDQHIWITIHLYLYIVLYVPFPRSLWLLCYTKWVIVAYILAYVHIGFSYCWKHDYYALSTTYVDHMGKSFLGFPCVADL